METQPSSGELMTQEELSAETGIPVRTLGQWRYLGKGPEYYKLGSRIRYPRSAVERWLADHLVVPGDSAA